MNEMKITFMGDILCEAPFYRSAYYDAKYHFDQSFSGLKKKCAESDIVIANLETPIAGNNKYVDDSFTMYSMNAPVEFAEAIKNAGVGFVLTGNNHCCDRGIAGLHATLDALDNVGLIHTGTFHDITESRYKTIEWQDKIIAVISCTASTNEEQTWIEPDVENVSLLKTQRKKRVISKPYDVIYNAKVFLSNRVIGSTKIYRIKSAIGQLTKRPVTDNHIDKDDVNKYLEGLNKIITEAKGNADLVFVCPHMGGQFNIKPGLFSEYVMSKISEMGADAIVSSHPHIVQKYESKNGVPCFYSLGNVLMSLSTKYILLDNLPDYGIMAHFYIEEKKIKRITFSIIQIEENKEGYLKVSPVYEQFTNSEGSKRENLIKQANAIVSRITGRQYEAKTIFDEYILY